MNQVRIKLKSNIIRNLYRGIDLRKLDRRVRSFLLFDALILFLCIMGVTHLSQKADLAFSVINNNGIFTADQNNHFLKGIQPGDTLISFDGLHFSGREGLEIYIDSKSIGEKITISYLRNGSKSTFQTRLIEFYTLPFIFSNSAAGLLFIAFAIFVLLKCPESKAARIFHWGSIGVAVMLLTTWGKYTIYPLGLGIAIRTVFHLSYVLTPAVFFHFSLAFPKDREKRFNYLIFAIYTACLLIAAINTYYFLKILPTPAQPAIDNYLSVFILNRLLAIFNILGAISIFVVSYFRTGNETEKKKLKWVLSGFLIGPLSFIALWTIPQIILNRPLMPEILIPLLMLSIPFTFTIAIVKYHLMDIDLLIRKSIVYSIVIFLLVIIYIGVISIISSQILLLSSQTPAILAAIIVALVFEPIRRRVQIYVDKKFFRVQYNFRETLRVFIRDISEKNSIKDLAEMVVRETQEFIPVKKLGFFLLKNNHISLIAHRNFDLLIGRSVPFDSLKLKSELIFPVADPAMVEPGVNFESADPVVFKRWGMDLVIPVRSGEGKIYSFLVFGEKKAGSRFTIEDIDLLSSISSNIASTMSRIYLQQELIRKSLEAEKLEELNKQKSMFVSTVSHDLKTPLASIKVFAEIMKADKQVSEKQKNYLEIIEGESDRLTRLINNVLGVAWIENGTRQYTFESASLNQIVQKTISALSYQLKMEGFQISIDLSPVDLHITADPDAIAEAVVNIIANAIKFSIQRKIISVSTYRSANLACVEVRDKGIGIKPEDLKDLFKPFFRSKIAGDKKISGTGLGLSIIKHVMDAHKGRIEVESIPDEGTAFILKFPVEIENDNCKDLITNPMQEEES